MRSFTRHALVVSAAVFSVCAAVAIVPDPAPAGQAIADAISSATGAPIAFVPDGVLNPSGKSDDLATWLQFPTDTVSVVKLTGRQIRAALERSVSLYPSPNPSFLQLSGIDVEFDKGLPPDKRVTSIQVPGGKLADEASYEVAMPTSLAKGGLGYFQIWEKTKVVKTMAKLSLGSICSKKPVYSTGSHWKQVGKG